MDFMAEYRRWLEFAGEDERAELNAIAAARGQTLAQLALAWALRIGGADALIVGARNAAQLTDSLGALTHVRLSNEELSAIEAILTREA